MFPLAAGRAEKAKAGPVGVAHLDQVSGPGCLWLGAHRNVAVTLASSAWAVSEPGGPGLVMVLVSKAAQPREKSSRARASLWLPRAILVRMTQALGAAVCEGQEVTCVEGVQRDDLTSTMLCVNSSGRQTH